jgi:hypothetical protein
MCKNEEKQEEEMGKGTILDVDLTIRKLKTYLQASHTERAYMYHNIQNPKPIVEKQTNKNSCDCQNF